MRYKARLVAKGYSQVVGVDFNETFAHVAKFSTIRCILALGVMMDLEMHQMDKKMAFLNGDLEKDIYMDQPQGFVQGDMVCKLKKSLYGLKPSPRAWYECIHAFFVKEGLVRSHANHSLYVVQSSTHIVIVIIYVDDLIILASNMTKLMQFKAKLEKEFDMSDLGKLHFLGVQIERNRAAHTFTMHQKSYIEGVLSRFSMEECKPLATPLDVKATLVKPSQEELEEFSQEMDGVPYKAIVGLLMYAMVVIRADLAFTVSVVSQFMGSPAPLHWMAVKCIMSYLKGTLDVKLCLRGALT